MTASEDERLARAALSRLGEPGDVRMNALVAEVGAQPLHGLLLSERGPDGLRSDIAVRLAAVDPDRELAHAARRGIRFVVPGDDEWPAGLDDLGRAAPAHERGGVPIGLWVRGAARLDQLEQSVAVVGSRAATTYGTAVAGEVAAVTGGAGFTVVSGGAFGIDVAAHRGAISARASTVAVLACGADRSYPTAHHELLEEVAATGAVVSEAPPGCAPQRIRFLARNRIIAALTRGTVVVEAARRSGALNTAGWATRLGRHLMGVPGPVTSPSSSGVHEQIRDGAMVLVTGGSHVLELVGEVGQHLPRSEPTPIRPRDRLSTRQAQVLDAVPVGAEAPVESIARVAGVGLIEVRRTLDRLLALGMVARADAGWRLTSRAHG